MPLFFGPRFHGASVMHLVFLFRNPGAVARAPKIERSRVPSWVSPLVLTPGSPPVTLPQQSSKGRKSQRAHTRFLCPPHHPPSDPRYPRFSFLETHGQRDVTRCPATDTVPCSPFFACSRSAAISVCRPLKPLVRPSPTAAVPPSTHSDFFFRARKVEEDDRRALSLLDYWVTGGGSFWV